VSVKVKICGVTSPEDARDATLAGADFIGVNFCPASPRLVSLEQAQMIAAAVPSVPLVGVFVDRPRDEIEAIVAAVGLRLVQLHGDEEPAQAGGFTVPVIKALRPRPGTDLGTLAARFATEYILADSYVPGRSGGTGVSLDLATIGGFDARRLFVAGGLRPETVAAVVRQVRPFAVDVASGVESKPGRKDREKVVEFIRRAKSA